MNKQRLLKMAGFVETLPRKDFDMSLFGIHRPDCGFTGCAMGHATHAKLFRGLSMRPCDCWTCRTGPADKRNIVVQYGDGEDFVAAALLFGVTETQAEVLFSEQDGDTPKRVSKRIRDFVKAES